MSEKPLRGRMRADWWVLCGGCGDSQWLDSYEVQQMGSLADVAKSKGWKYTKALGWTCPNCLKVRS